MPRSDGDLEFDEIEAGDLLGDRMLHLQARVHFQKIEIEMGIYEEFDCAGIHVTSGARQADGRIAHFLAQVGRDNRRRRFLDDFLMAALNGTLSFAERHHSAVRVRKNLNLHVARTLQIFF